MIIALTFKKAAKKSETKALCSIANAVLDCLFPDAPIRKDMKDPTINYVFDVQPSELEKLEAEILLVNANIRKYDEAVNGDTFEVISPKPSVS